MSTTTTARDRGDRYGPMEWAQLGHHERWFTRYIEYSKSKPPIRTAVYMQLGHKSF